MTPRSRIIAVQVVVVGALVAAVFLTLLRPDGPQSLSGLDAPGGLETGVVPTPESYDSRDEPGPGAGDQGGTAPPVSVAPPETTPPGTTPDTGDVADGGDPGSPTDDQYADTLTRLMARLN